MSAEIQVSCFDVTRVTIAIESLQCTVQCSGNAPGVREPTNANQKLNCSPQNSS